MPIATVQFSNLKYLDKRDINTKKFTSGYIFLLAGEAISWKSMKQSTITMSIEFVACLETTTDALWL